MDTMLVLYSKSRKMRSENVSIRTHVLEWEARKISEFLLPQSLSCHFISTPKKLVRATSPPLVGLVCVGPIPPPSRGSASPLDQSTSFLPASVTALLGSTTTVESTMVGRPGCGRRTGSGMPRPSSPMPGATDGTHAGVIGIGAGCPRRPPRPSSTPSASLLGRFSIRHSGRAPGRRILRCAWGRRPHSESTPRRRVRA
jgi:hypothetical protein